MTVLDQDELLNYNILVYFPSLEEQTDPLLLKELNLELICADLHLLEHPIYEDYRLQNIDFKEFIETVKIDITSKKIHKKEYDFVEEIEN